MAVTVNKTIQMDGSTYLADQNTYDRSAIPGRGSLEINPSIRSMCLQIKGDRVGQESLKLCVTNEEALLLSKLLIELIDKSGE